MAHARLLQRKPFMKALYLDWYRQMERAVHGVPDGLHLEIGSGGGCIREVMPAVRTSDILALPGVDACHAAEALPYEDQSLAAIFMLNTLHHLPSVESFFGEAVRCLKAGGRIVCIEPAHTVWSRLIYQNLHHEPFDPSGGWELPSGRPLSMSNQALPWIVFQRDRHLFVEKFPQLAILGLALHTPLRYLMSGGFSYRPFVPACMHAPCRLGEQMVSPLNRWIAMFMTVVLERRTA
ncbi:MAG: class I SAM-dependent methyltransferase [Candidatus Xenobia bacterium]